MKEKKTTKEEIKTLENLVIKLQVDYGAKLKESNPSSEVSFSDGHNAAIQVIRSHIEYLDTYEEDPLDVLFKTPEEIEEIRQEEKQKEQIELKVSSLDERVSTVEEAFKVKYQKLTKRHLRYLDAFKSLLTKNIERHESFAKAYNLDRVLEAVEDEAVKTSYERI